MTKLWDYLRTSFWVIPAVMAAGAVALSAITLRVDRQAAIDRWRSIEWVIINNPDGARELLSTVAGSMITVAGVVFSITVVALTMASNQFGPRLLRRFTADPGNQIVLGTFVATFLYCLLVLRTIQAVDDNRFVPHLSVTTSVALTVLNVGVLIYFIDHVARSIQVSRITAGVGHDLRQAVDRGFPAEWGAGQDGDGDVDDLPEDWSEAAAAVAAETSGYVVAFDQKAVLRAASACDAVVRIEARPGTFVIDGQHLAYVWPAERCTEDLKRRLRQAMVIGDVRTPVQDIEYLVHQLVQLALRALSPAVNDPITAVNCLDWLGMGLGRMASRELPSPYRYHHGRLRAIVDVRDFAAVADGALDALRPAVSEHLVVTVHLLRVLTQVAALATRDEDRETLRRHTSQISAAARRQLADDRDLAQVDACRYELLQALGQADEAPDQARAADPSMRAV